MKLNLSSLFVPVLSLLGIGVITPAVCQETPSSATYQIVSGNYHEEGGFGGAYTAPLPAPAQSFVVLTIPGGGGPIALDFLGSDRKSALIHLTNGYVNGNTIQFHYDTVNPVDHTTPARVDYVITNSGGSISVSGSITSAPVCCDITYYYQHQHVQGVFAPVAALSAGGQKGISWTSASNQKYQVQFRSDLLGAAWVNLGGPVMGTGITNFASDPGALSTGQRYYRIVTVP